MNVESQIERRPLLDADLRKFIAAGYLWAVVDATDAPAVPQKAAELGPARALCLFQGEAEEREADTAPYLFLVDEALLAWLKETLWDEPWGILAAAATDLESLRKHFRRFLWVTAPDGAEKWYFRFYDPRVLAMYLPTCTPAELSWFHGPVRTFAVTNEDGGIDLLAPRAGLAPGPKGTPPPAGLWRIRQPQVDALQVDLERNFVHKMAGMLGDEFPRFVEGLAAQVLDERIWLGLARARSHGLSRESSLASFIMMMFVVGPDFDLTPGMKELFDDETEDPDWRMERVSDLPQEVWREASGPARAGGWKARPGEEAR
jgi:hypothetical protein